VLSCLLSTAPPYLADELCRVAEVDSRRRLMAWDVTVPDTYAESHVSSTAVTPGVAAHRAAQSKTDKYTRLASTHIFCPQELAGASRLSLRTPGKQSSSSNACPWLFNGECGLLQEQYDHRMKRRCSHLLCLVSVFPPAALC